MDFTRQLYYERAKRYHVQVVDEAESPRGMAKLQGTKKKRTKGYAKVRWYISFLLGIDQKKESTKKRREEGGRRRDRGERQVGRQAVGSPSEELEERQREKEREK